MMDPAKTRNHEQLKILFDKTIKINPEKAIEFAKIIIYQAKKQGNNIHLAEGYFLISQLNGSQNSPKYLDSMISVSKKLKDTDNLSKAYTYKGNYYYSLGEYSKSLDNYLTARGYAENNIKTYNIINFNIGLLKLELENYDEAINLFLGYKNFLEKNHISKHDNYERCLYALAYSYNKIKQVNTSDEYLKLGFEKNKISGNRSSYANLMLVTGLNEYSSGNYNKSLETFSQVAILLKKYSPDNLNIALSEYYSGKILTKTGKDGFLNKYQNVDAYIKETNDVSFELRDVYPTLIDFYKKNGNKDQQLYYIERLLIVDSLLYKKYNKLAVEISKKYDTPILLSEKEKLIYELNSKNHFLFWVVGLGGFVICILIFLFVDNRKKIKLYKNKAEKLSQIPVVPIFEVSEIADRFTEEKIKTTLSDDQLKLLDIKLYEFEKEKGFLNKNINLDILAKELNTNRAYLSKSVNELKGKNFSQYLNELRIYYIVEELKINKTLQKYTIASIAESAGFNNSESFTNAFRKITGTLPSYFIKALNKNS
ncbi:helix-turn-helix transcriptional regulator [Epilithonimonas sp.]|uniref:helix-turn-helix transcriptional regulator n=1 Tax=Epilithonimonas sp. TaxID=2894511 RepID=UPI00289F600E|nr:helix-turn-helix transcriptional regulator [Epilithonimonas sp.]